MNSLNFSGTWMARWYDHYVALGGRRRDPENLCRFIRVCFIWAPLRWFFSARNGRECPFAYVMLSSLAVLLTGALAVQTYIHSLIVLRIVGAIIVGAGLAYIIGLSGVLPRVSKFSAGVKDSIRMMKFYREASASRLCPYVQLNDNKGDGDVQNPSVSDAE